ncbi:MAG TPA: OmpA family protein [Polyangiaceae bacterium]|nr:OmpA family protein [Polyangiaceae bacterium]
MPDRREFRPLRVSPLVLSSALLVAFHAVAAGPGDPGGGAAALQAKGGAKAPLQIDLDKDKVDLKGHRLELKLSRDAAKVTIKVVGDSGAVLADQTHEFRGQRAGTPLVVTWSPSREEPVARIELFAYDTEGYYKGVALTPWSVSIPHEEVNFATGSAQIGASEQPKLEASYAKIADAVAKHEALGRVTLFVAGHTDTVGGDASNLRLSQQRAQAIAAWFRKRGVKVGIAYEGFGESSPLVKTADEVDEPRNRRADYILSLDEPTLKTSGFRPAWKRVP